MSTLIEAKALELHTKRGPVYEPVDLNLVSGISVLTGPVGSGRTSLLLTLSGRMRPSSGTLTTLGLPLPKSWRRVQKLTGIAGFATIDDLEESVTVADAIRERAAWTSPWYRIVRRPMQDRVDRVLAPVFGDERIEARTPIHRLSDVDQLSLQIALALMTGPRLLFIDSIEQVQASSSRAIVWRRLAHIVEQGTDVIVAAADDDAEHWQGLTIPLHVIDLTPKAAH